MAEETGKQEKSEKDDDLLQDALERAQICTDYYSTEYSRGSEDVSFALMGDQWPDEIKSKRQKEGRPCLTENRVHASILQVINSMRQTRPAIQVNPIDSKADVETARVMKGIVRNIETQSCADNAYDTAALNAVSAGYGWIRVNTQYADDESFDQEIKIERVANFSTVMLDPNSKELDGSDAEYGFIFTDTEHEAFEAEYPDAEPISAEGYGSTDGWYSDESVRVAEYFYKEYEEISIVQTPQGIMKKDDAEAAGLDILQERVVKQPKIKWCKFTGCEVLEETDWLGKYIPLVPVYGEEVNDDGRRKFLSLVYHAKDPQRRFNYWLTAGTEIVALQPKAPFVGMVGQFKSAARKWAQANNETYAFLEYDPVKLPDGTYAAVPPQRQPAPQGSPAMYQETLSAADGIKAALGIFDASLGANGNEKSGKAILARQAQGDNSTFHFVDNLQTSIRHVGRILIDLIPKVYTGQRIMRIIGDDGSKAMVPINQPVIKQAKGNYAPAGNNPSQAFFNLGVGKYDVIATVGQSAVSQRRESAELLQSMMTALPQTIPVLGDLFVKNLDLPESEQIVERLRKLFPQMQDDGDPNAQKLQQADQAIKALQNQIEQMGQALDAKKQKTDAETQAELEESKAKTEKTYAEADKIKADADKARADAELARAQAADAIASAQAAGLTPEHVAEVIRTIAELEAMSKDTAEAVHHILTAEEMRQAAPPPAPVPIAPPVVQSPQEEVVEALKKKKGKKSAKYFDAEGNPTDKPPAEAIKFDASGKMVK